MGSKIYPIGVQSFEKIRKEGYFYIDKTALVYQLVKTGSYYSLSRPRRFGKVFLFLRSKPAFKENGNSLKGWLWRSWKKIGKIFCITS